MSKLKGKIALITGASRGIGRSIALGLAREGALVAVHYGNRKQEAEEVVQEIQLSGGSAFSICANLNELNDIHALFASLDEVLQKRTGDNRFDILVNNAGIGQYATIEETTEQSFDEVMSLPCESTTFYHTASFTSFKR